MTKDNKKQPVHGKRKHPQSEGPSDRSRRQFLRSGAIAGVGGAAALAALGTSAAAAPHPTREIEWDREVDVVVIGAGASGMCAAVAAREEGAEVMLVEHHFDIGGIAIMSGGDIRIGGGIRFREAEGPGRKRQSLR